MGLHRQILDAWPSGPNFLSFHAVLVKIWLNNSLVPPFRVGDPVENPETVTELCFNLPS